MRIGLAGRLVLLCGVAALPTMRAMGAVNAYMIIEGSGQGKMKGESSRGSSPEQIRLISVARGTSSGMAAGRRTHQPITITKEIDASSAMLKQSLAKSETLGDVVIMFEGAGGSQKAAQKILLKGTFITGIRIVGKAEEISLDYQTIEVTYVNGNKTASDDWETPR